MNLRGNRTTNPHRLGGFALPTILIASIVMLTVLLVSVTSTTAIRAGLTSQYNDQLSQVAADAGVAYAKACLNANNGVSQWNNDNPLKPDTNCDGTPLTSCPVSPTNAACHSFMVSANGKIKTTFSVGLNQPLPPSTWKEIASGDMHTCAIGYDNSKVYCWGNNVYGQLGDRSTVNRYTPTAVDTVGTTMDGKTITSISVGIWHSCAVDSDYKAYCWGNNSNGELGNSSKVLSKVPVSVYTHGALAGLKVKSISAGEKHTCAVASNPDDSNSQAYCWGYNEDGGLGTGSDGPPVTTPVAVNTTNGVSALYGKTVNSISSGSLFSCAIANDDQAYCWGYNGNGEVGDNSQTEKDAPVAVGGAVCAGALCGKTVKSISSASGGNHTCVKAYDITDGDQAYCWGYNGYGETGMNSTTTPQKIPVAVIRTGALVGRTIESISSGWWSSCAVADNHLVYCWGRNSYGQLGDNTTTSKSYPVEVNRVENVSALFGKTVKSVSAGFAHVCAIANDDKAYCWGYNNVGMIGDNTVTQRNVPVAVNISGVLVETIASSGTVNLVRTSDGSKWRSYNQTSRLNLTELASNGWFLSQTLSAANDHTCAIDSNNQAYCWGMNEKNQLGTSSSISRMSPFPVYNTGSLQGLTVKSISAGDEHTCVIASDNNAYCWGSGSDGQIGNNSTSAKSVPTPVNTASGTSALYGKTVEAMSSLKQHTCVIANDGWVYCWGTNDHGELGDGTTTQRNAPVAVGGTPTCSGVMCGKTIIAISAGYYHTCAIDSNGQAYCWGYNGYGQLGDNSTGQKTTPVAVGGTPSCVGTLCTKTVLSISAGTNHTCAIDSTNIAHCWGRNNYGQLGDNSTGQKTTPVAVNTAGVLSSGKKVELISAGYYHTCVIASNSDDTNSQAYCWGLRNYGALGDNSTTSYSQVPVAVYNTGVLNGLTITSLDAGYYHNCVVASDSHTYCWGRNVFGQLGDNSTDESTIPVATIRESDHTLHTGY